MARASEKAESMKLDLAFSSMRCLVSDLEGARARMRLSKASWLVSPRTSLRA